MGMSLPQLGTLARNCLGARWRWGTLRGEQLAAFQQHRARAMVKFARRHAPFYQAHWAGYNLNDRQTLPVVDKQLMMDHFATFNTQGIEREAAMSVALEAERSRDFHPTLGDITIGLSSGTSGHRGLFLVSPREQAGWAGIILARVLHQYVAGLQVVFFCGPIATSMSRSAAA